MVMPNDKRSCIDNGPTTQLHRKLQSYPMNMPTRAETNINTNQLLEANVPELMSRICGC